MRLVTVVVLGGLFVLFGALVVFGLGLSSTGGTLTEVWVSETPRDNQVNHHAVGVGPDGEVIVAPVAEVPHSNVPITNTSCALARLAPRNGSVLWRAGVPAEDCFTHALTEPAIADIDGDGTLEVVASTTENALVVYDARSGHEEFRVPLVTYGYGRPTIADIHPASGNELITSDINGHVVAAYANGSASWRVLLNKTVGDSPVVWNAPVVADVDADGIVEVVIGTSRGPVVLAPNGTVEWSKREGAAYLTTAQADSDQSREIFTASTGAIRAFDGATGDLEWTREFRGSTRIHSAADADNDGTVDLFVGRVNGKVLALNAGTGDTEWSTTVATGEDSTLPSPVLGDVNGDGRFEVIAVTNAGTVTVLEPESGTELAAYERNVPIWTFPTPADIDDDGRAEILVRYGDGRVVALDYAS